METPTMTQNTQVAVLQPQELVRQSSDIAGLCREIVEKRAIEIQGRRYLPVEPWMAIATAHGCIASARDVERVEGGYKAVGEIRRMSDGVVISSAEGFVGEDEPTWFGGVVHGKNGAKTLPKRPDYAIRAMCQTRAVSRACRTAFAHVVVLMDAGLSTTPAEEVPADGFDDHPTTAPQRQAAAPRNVTPAREVSMSGWRGVVVPPFIKRHAGKFLGEMPDKDVLWWAQNYTPKPYKGSITAADTQFRAWLDEARAELESRPTAEEIGEAFPEDRSNPDLEEAQPPF